MKTIEEKARAYDEALERARELIAKWTGKNKDFYVEDYSYIFPELRESEDERILASIADCVGLMGEDGDVFSNHNVTKVQVLSWLEKQKENIEKEYVFRPLAGTDITIAAEQAIRRAMEGDHLVLAFNGWYVPVDKHATVKGLVDSYDTFIEKQKEQDKCPEYCVRSHCFGCSIYEKQKERWPVDLQVKGDGVYKICPHCNERMIRDDSKVYTSIPPQYGYNCPKCGAFEFDTVMYDSPVKEEQKPEEKHYWNPTEEDVELFNKAVKTNTQLIPSERAKLDIIRMKFKHRPTIEQKEQKPADDKDFEDNTVNVRMITDSKTGEKYPFVSYKDQLQKPAEFGDDIVEDAEDYTSKVECGQYGVAVTEAYIAGALRERKKNKPAEWNEEDEKMRTNTILSLQSLVDEGIHQGFVNNVKKEITWLKSLSLNLKKKNEDAVKLCSNEWSEEDDGVLGQIITAFHRIANGCEHYFSQDTARVFEEKLKSLHPHWKPSEEDIKMLEHIIGQYEIGNKNCNTVGYLPRVEELNFLKKILDIWKN